MWNTISSIMMRSEVFLKFIYIWEWYESSFITNVYYLT
ncbi:unnamed protein product [Spirodela intermedia]|uniref:Uncharacterized protein n=1 Tax=Spirodela intermedia TaxID=51605 RepID=A0A7I8K6A7_SPIIN|nr:unnamed protein product [Spirodela intermedia]